ncbi:MAG TPA: L-threonylcarbamoyladenylate synthase [Gemmataceae bacterium]|nr:L-threonylcarbamoyladenylate synthase [Gemmataceae bacterium]
MDNIETSATLIHEAAAMLREGSLVAFPTETVYGLGANALDANAVGRIFEAKGRPANNPIIVHIAEPESVRQVAVSWPENAEKLAHHFWPGPLTLVLLRSPALPPIVAAGGPTVAVRMPAHPVALTLIHAAGVPIAAPSANRSGEVSATTAEHVLKSLGGRIDMILDAGSTQVGLESTVLDLAQTPPRLLRPGHVSRAEIEKLIGPIAWSEVHGSAPTAALPSPGLLAKHYAPRTFTECINPPGLEIIRQRSQHGSRVGWLAFGEPAERIPGVVTVIMPQHPHDYAARLYAELHRLDAMGLDRIIVDWPPDNDEWLAVRDRLRRASAHD